MKRAVLLLIIFILAFSSLFSENVQSEYEKFLKKYKEGNVSEALEGFLKLSSEHPNSALAPEMKKLIAESENEYFIAITKWQDIFVRYEDYEKRDYVAFRIAMLYLLHSDYKPALKYFDYVRENYPNSEYAKLASIKIAAINLSLGNLKRAMTLYLSLAKENEKEKNKYYHEGLFGIANTLFAQKKYSKAVGFYLAVCSYKSEFDEHPLARYRLASSYDNMEKRKKALTVYKDVVSKYPYSFAALLAKQKLKSYGIDLKETDEDELIYEEDVSYDLDEIEEENAKAENSIEEKKPLKDGVMIQVGRFKEEARAKKYLKKVRSFGFSADIFKDSSLSEISYRVIVFGSLGKEAEEVKEDLRDKGIPGFRVYE